MFVNFLNFYLYNLFKLYLTDAKDSEKSTPVPTPGCSPYYGPLEKDKCEEVIAKKPKKSKHKDRSKRSRSRSPRRRRRQSRSPSPVRKLNRYMYNLSRLSKLLNISSEPADCFTVTSMSRARNQWIVWKNFIPSCGKSFPKSQIMLRYNVHIPE